MRMTRVLAVLTTAAAFAALAPPALADGPDATASKSCSVGNSRSYGTTYVISISVSNTSCRSGRRVIRGFHDCRPRKTGSCESSVLGYSCRENRFNRGKTQYDSRVTCTKGSRVVRHTYTQYT
jgi:hypothetical protein